MGFSFKNEGDDDGAEIHEINVTPFIDVMLVLLIIFMIAAPLSTVDLNVDLPSSSAAQTPQRPDDPLVLTIRSDGGLIVGEESVTLDGLVDRLVRESGGDREKRIYLRADKQLEYGELMRVIDTMRASGFRKVAFVSQEGASAGASPR